MIRSGWLHGILLISMTVGCSAGGGLSLCPVGNYLTKPARNSLEHSPIGVGLPRELARSVVPAHFLQPGDMVVIEPVKLDSDVRLPADQRVMADGTVDLGGYGRVVVAGLTIEAAERLIETRIVDAGGEATRVSLRLIEPQQVYYVLGEVNSPGAIPLIGSETVLDAILAAGGLNDRASLCDLMLVRPTTPKSCRVTLPICYAAITQLGDTTTNYQLQPGDRIFVATRTFSEDLKFWLSKEGCERCTGAQCPCPSPEVVATDGNPIVQPLPQGPEPVELEPAEPASKQDAKAPAGTPIERVELPPRLSPLTPLPDDDVQLAEPRAPKPSSDELPPLETLELPADPTPDRPDPFEADNFFNRPE